MNFNPNPRITGLRNSDLPKVVGSDADCIDPEIPVAVAALGGLDTVLYTCGRPSVYVGI